MALTQAIAYSFKEQLFQGTHNFANGGSTFKAALYAAGVTGSTLDGTITQYTTANYGTYEQANGNGYTTGGQTLTSQTTSRSSQTAWVDFADVTWATSTIDARASLIFNTTTNNPAVCVLDFGSTKSSSNGSFTIQFPTADATNAIIRIA